MSVRETVEGFEAYSIADVSAYARTSTQAVALLERSQSTTRRKARKATPLALGETARAPIAPRGRKPLVSLSLDAKRSLLITAPAKPSTPKGANDWEFHGYLAHLVAATRSGVSEGDTGWCELGLGKSFDDLDPRVVRSLKGKKRMAAYKQGYQSKLGGYPYFPQQELVAACFRCGKPLDFFAQLGDSVADFMADWLLYVFVCPQGCEARVASQS